MGLLIMLLRVAVGLCTGVIAAICFVVLVTTHDGFTGIVALLAFALFTTATIGVALK